MKEIKEIAKKLSDGEVREAAELRGKIAFSDAALELELVEVVRQAMISRLKKGDFDTVSSVALQFSLSRQIIDSTLKQGILSIYYEGNNPLLHEIHQRFHLSPELREDIAGYCESWGKRAEAATLRNLFS